MSQTTPTNTGPLAVALVFTDLAAVDAHQGSAYYGEYVMTDLYGMLESDGPTIET
jgi:hypothetical protein